MERCGNAPRANLPRGNKPRVRIAMKNVIGRPRRYVAKCPSAISGQGGHNATFHVAAVLAHGFALGGADALTLLKEFNQRCLPPWSEGELIHKIKSAANAAHLLPRGHLLGGENGSPVSKKPMPPPPPK